MWAVRDSFDGEIRCRGRPMSQPRDDRQDDLFRPLLEEIINFRHPLVRLAGEINWDFLAKQVVLAIVARLAHRSPRQRISPSKESRTAQIGNPKPQENRHANPAFLQNRLLAQVKSSRSINRFRILISCPLRSRFEGWPNCEGLE